MLKKLVKKLKKRDGFTLAELVVTTAVMGTLAAVAVPRFSDVNEIAKERKTMSNIDNIISGAQNYYNDMTVRMGRGSFPGQTRYNDTVGETSVFFGSDSTFIVLFGGYTVDSPYEDGEYMYSVAAGGGVGDKSFSPTITVWDKEDVSTLIRSYTP